MTKNIVQGINPHPKKYPPKWAWLDNFKAKIRKIKIVISSTE